MAIYHPGRVYIPDGHDRCSRCGGNGREARKRESWEAPIFGDDTVTCGECRGLGFIPHKSVEGKMKEDKAILCSVQLLTNNIAEMVTTKFPVGTLVDVSSLNEALIYLNLALEMEILKLDEHSPD
jgi:hypothetical protein